MHRVLLFFDLFVVVMVILKCHELIFPNRIDSLEMELYTQSHIPQYIHTHKGVYVITHTKDKTRFVKMSSVVFLV